MHGLDEKADFSFLINRKLEQVCLGKHQAQLRFDGSVWIDFEGEFTLDGRRYTVQDAHLTHELIESRIQSAWRQEPGDAHIQFDRHLLILHDSNDHYESYGIYGDGVSIIV